jgi:hypothetical protein
MTLCSLIEVSRYCGRTYCLYLQVQKAINTVSRQGKDDSVTELETSLHDISVFVLLPSSGPTLVTLYIFYWFSLGAFKCPLSQPGFPRVTQGKRSQKWTTRSSSPKIEA